MVPHMYDLMVPPYLIWNSYHLASHMYVWSPLHVQSDGPLTLYGTGIIWFPTCTYGPPHVWSDGPSLSYMEQLSYGSPTCAYGPPTCKIWFFQDSLGKSPLHVLKNVKINLNNCTSALLIWLLWSPIPYMNRYLMVPPYLIWNRYCMVLSHTYIWSPHMWSVVMSYMTLMVPLPYME